MVLQDAPDSRAAEDTIEALRDAVHRAGGSDTLVGGTTAETLDTRRAAGRDLRTVVPVVLLVVLVVLIALLRALVAPLLLLATVVLSYAAALGASNLLFEHVLGFAGVDWSIPLMGFVFLVALGIDYNIFLMHRVQEETARLGHARGVLEGLTGTGGVITSAGIVLAATFAILAGLPLVTMAQMGVLVGLGILLDTFLVRTVLVPALALDPGRPFWWPGGLSRGPDRPDGDASASTATTARDPAHEVAQDRRAGDDLTPVPVSVPSAHARTPRGRSVTSGRGNVHAGRVLGESARHGLHEAAEIPLEEPAHPRASQVRTVPVDPRAAIGQPVQFDSGPVIGHLRILHALVREPSS